MNWEVIIKWLPKFVQGAILTLELVGIAVILGLILAIPLGIARSSKRWYIRSLPYAYIFFFRGTPLLVQLFLIFYGLPSAGIVLAAVFAALGVLPLVTLGQIGLIVGIGVLIDAFLVRQPGAQRVSEERLLPQDDRDGFYYALLRKPD